MLDYSEWCATCRVLLCPVPWSLYWYVHGYSLCKKKILCVMNNCSTLCQWFSLQVQVWDMISLPDVLELNLCLSEEKYYSDRVAQVWLTLFWHRVIFYTTGKRWHEMHQVHVQSKQFITYLLLLSDNFLKVAYFMCNTLKQFTKLSKTWHSRSWFMITVLSQIAQFSCFIVCEWFCIQFL